MVLCLKKERAGKLKEKKRLKLSNLTQIVYFFIEILDFLLLRLILSIFWKGFWGCMCVSHNPNSHEEEDSASATG